MLDDLDAVVRSRPVDVPGIAVGWTINGDTHLAFDGLADVERDVPVDAATRFQLGSVTKTFTATTALALVEQGVLSLDGLVSRWLGDIDFGSAAPTLTLRHLLTHRGGWQGDWALFNAPATRDASALGELVSMTPQVPRYGEPGGPFSYDNFGYCVLGAVIEAATGLCFDDAVRSLVLEPLRLAETGFRADDAVSRRFAIGHTATASRDGVRTAEGTEPWADEWPIRRALSPTGGVVSTVGDAMRWARFHLDGSTAGSAPISDSMRARMQQPEAASGGQGVEVALGWHVRYAAGIRVLSHTGAAQGFFAHVCIVPARAAAMAILTNGANGAAVAEPTYRWLVERGLGLSVDAPAVVESARGHVEIDGTYHAESRTIRLRTRGDRIVAEVNDSGPTWGGTRTTALRFAEGNRLVGDDAPQVRMEYGAFDNGRRWLRYRGRIHV